MNIFPAVSCKLVGSSGFEPPTSRLSGARSNQLSYEPMSLKESFLFFSLKSLPFLIPKQGWWRWWDSNPWPPACRAGALPTELHPHVGYPSSSFVLLFTMNKNESLHTTDTLEKTSSMRDFQVPAHCLTTPALRYADTTHSKLNNNILTPIWFRVGTRISRSP